MIFACRRARDELMPKLASIVRTIERSTEPVALGNDPEQREERVADEFVLVAAQKSLAGEIDTRQTARQILRENDVAGLFDEVAVTGFQTRTFQQTRHLCDQPRRVKRNFEVVVSACAETGHDSFSVFLQRADQQDRN